MMFPSEEEYFLLITETGSMGRSPHCLVRKVI